METLAAVIVFYIQESQMKIDDDAPASNSINMSNDSTAWSDLNYRMVKSGC